MNASRFLAAFLLLLCCFQANGLGASSDIGSLKVGQSIGNLRVSHLYENSSKQVMGAKLEDSRTGAPIYFFTIETAPQAFMWVDCPAGSETGLAHSIEHLVTGKGTKGRRLRALTQMRLSRSASATTDDYSFYSFASGTGVESFFEQFHAWLDALYQADFTNLEAERELYHFGISGLPRNSSTALIEKGSVYDEMQTGLGDAYYFELNRLAFGDRNPFAYNIAGVPDEMRNVTPGEIRGLYTKKYHLGPTTGFIFVVDPKENVFDFLQRVSRDLQQFSNTQQISRPDSPRQEPKYPVNPSPLKEPRIIPFPSSSETDPAEVGFGWKPVETNSQAQVKLLQLFFRILGEGQQSLLYKTLIDRRARQMDSGVTSIEPLVFLKNSPHFPAEFIGLSGIPGNQVNVEKIKQLRSLISAKIAEISSYPDNSDVLATFNRAAMSQANAWRRSQQIWERNTPGFGIKYETQWKEYLEYLEMDSSSVRSLSDEPTWDELNKQLHSGRNIWHDLIEHFHLLDVPYATASLPSPRLLEKSETDRQDRLRGKLQRLMERYRTSDEQTALKDFAKEEGAKTREIDQIAARVVQPKFTENPPLTPDDGLRYSQLQLEGRPVITTLFNRAPTIDVGLSFDLRKIPERYFKYLPILPRCIDSLGLKASSQTVSYSDLLAKIQAETSGLTVGYEFNPASSRADLTIRISAINPQELRSGLSLVRKLIDSNYLASSNVDRLRDLVDKRLGEDNTFDKGGDYYWFLNPAYAFRYQNDHLYLALSSEITRAHWDERLKWSLHQPVLPSEIEELVGFAKKTLTDASGLSREQLSDFLNRSHAKALKAELVEYWKASLPLFAESELMAGLERLTAEVEQDLRIGPDKTIAEVRELQRLAIDRRALNIDLTVNESMNTEAWDALVDFLKTLPLGEDSQSATAPSSNNSTPVIQHIERRYQARINNGFPWYVGFADPQNSTASMFFVADYPGYTDIKRDTLVQVLSSKMVTGAGPQTPYMKVEEDGLAYGTGITGDPGRRTISYYAERSPDIVALLELVNSTVAALPQSHDPHLIDYALQQTFPIPRSMATFSERGRGIAADIRDGNDPQTIRGFSQAVLELRKDPKLLSELHRTLLDSIGPVLVNQEFEKQQKEKRSLFFLVGPERLLSVAETGLHISLYRAYPSDFWIDF